eukprot:TRINITY_DN773_c0_g1_i1.p2 TRINITY_DN773_c0_g1~~TRINITY_DN773_c0_g1_i1.p2  ORF type:complete len:355 (-),score=52.04 TRINITY_DN773_c0_g1_i1:2552-3616(-)
MADLSATELSKAVQNICSTRLTQSRPIRRVQLPQRESIQPSGPRAPNEGIDEQEQGVYYAELLDNGSVAIYITMLAAGFVIGTRGFSIRQICEVTRAFIRSETIKPGRFPRTTRLFEISGSQEACKQALNIIMAAVDLYKKLTEGEMEGQRVEQIQHAANIAFVYQPPPHRMVPQAAQLIQSGNEFVVSPQVTPPALPQVPQMGSQSMVGLRRNRSAPIIPPAVCLGLSDGMSTAQLSSFDDALMTRMLASTPYIGQGQDCSMLSIPYSTSPYSSSFQDREVLGMLNMNTYDGGVTRCNPLPPYAPSTSSPWRQVSAPAVPTILEDRPPYMDGNNDDMENTLRNILDNLNLGSK